MSVAFRRYSGIIDADSGGWKGARFEAQVIDFSDQRVVITGAAGSVGSALVAGFQAQGAQVVACDRHPVTRQRFAQAECHGFDFTDASATLNAARSIVAGGVPDVVISNAGGTRAETLEQLQHESLFDAEMEANFRGAARFTEALLPAMRKRGSGAFVFVTSVNALAHFGNPAYSAAKAALLAWMRAIATEAGGDGVRANALAPGSIHTALWDARIERDPGVLDKVKRLYPIGRLVTPEEVAQAAQFLASGWASGINGVTLPVDGGLCAGNLPFLNLIE